MHVGQDGLGGGAIGRGSGNGEANDCDCDVQDEGLKLVHHGLNVSLYGLTDLFMDVRNYVKYPEHARGRVGGCRVWNKTGNLWNKCRMARAAF